VETTLQKLYSQVFSIVKQVSWLQLVPIYHLFVNSITGITSFYTGAFPFYCI